ncbi:PREDICTED: apoptosis facilitator Bcl-2-like protein 14 [Poecilia mexicana]|uniref:apoptosis facilitator Bcl-2-like protein 14 n=1 Tax=Poecilia formosa TaxID=48698 RepID=UPI000444608F|nr:PREDICTED: apoptosis facilitator Bcl-2-like protein 14 [Poecilia formosa]XP_007542416.1 PREDICTED: apoptosis facilitator Bcl-2-like protein 14 [Poecilia formosa]XP_007542417.1 PREDICTED: apoptosis facilitator Bcl-2-like protein 14 [Poecilia formosa]XP_014828141.1 PREDICTED: apoptosis facilitator Bcl-2-like protein 14 [Poecilia mexicana]XP_014828142.1 PREDICTED: apoptosis facilitator Bcl-2-like protein 14 [Poecilia mexicana]XP_014828143.1 PREDICTED: apoptosis facilitator Bcl-2-like protein 1
MESLQDQDKLLLLVEKYCNLRSPPVLHLKGLGEPGRPSAPSLYKQSKKVVIAQTLFLDIESDSLDRSGSVKKAQNVPRQLAKIADSAPIVEQNLQTQDEIIQRLVKLMITLGDDINVKLKQNPALQQQLQNLNYNLFEKLTCTVQNLVVPPDQAACPDGLVQKQRIAWAFEVTSRLSSVTVVQRRAIQQFGARYIAENHAGWVQQQGGWEEAFD